MKRKITFLIAVVVMLLSLIVQPITANGQVVSATTYNTLPGNLPTNWSGSQTTSNSTNYFSLTYSSDYLQTPTIAQNGFTSITIKARMYGGPTDAQKVITVSWYDVNTKTETILTTISPSNTSLKDYTVSANDFTNTPTANTKGYIKLQCKSAGSNKGSAVSQFTLTYTAHTITYSATNGSISGTKVVGGSAVNTGALLALGEQVTVTATPSSGYQFASWEVLGTGSSVANSGSATTTFTMGSVNSNLTAVFAENSTTYTVSIDPGITHGTVNASPTSCISGTTVTLTVTPDSGYVLGSLIVNKEGGGTVEVTSNQFTMPADNVTVTAEFLPVFSVSIDPGITNGSVSASPTSGIAGTTITLTPTPSDGYVFGSWDVYKSGDESIKVSVTNNQFTMPSYNVVASASFVERSATFTDGEYWAMTDDDDDWGNFMAINVTGEQVWEYYTSNSFNAAHINGYSSGAKENEDWLISPKMTAENGKLLVSFVTKRPHDGSLVAYYSTDYNGYSDPNDQGTWNNLGATIATSSDWTESGDKVITGANIYVAFKYTSTTSKAGEFYVGDFCAKQYYPVTYDANGGSGTMADASSPYAVGATVTVKSNSFTAPASSAFKRWNTSSDGSGISYEPAATFEMGNEAITLYAQWGVTHDITYPVSYTHGDVTTAPTTAFVGDIVTIVTDPDDTYHVASMTATYGSNDLSYNIDGNNITFTMPNNDVVISEIAFEQTVHTITYMINGEVGTGTYKPVDIVDGNSIATLPTGVTPPTGFAFAGWTESEALSIEDNPYTPTKSVTLEAVFSRTEADKVPAYKLVESSLDDYTGEYLIVYNNTYALNTHYGNKNTNTYGTYASISTYYSSSNKTIEHNNTTSSYRVTAAATTNGYSLLDNGDNTYLGNTNNSNGAYLRWDEEFTTKQNEWTLGVNSIVSANNTGKAIRWNNNSGSERFAIYATDGQQSIQLFKKQLVDKNVTKYYTRVLEDDFEATEDVVITTPVVIPNGMVYDMNGHNLTSTDASNLIIEDGGQLICSNSDAVAATFKKEIDAPVAKTEEYNSWYTISSPVTDGTHDYIAIASLPSLIAVDYDMLAYDEVNHTWRNQKAGSGATGFSNMDKGQGYMYRNDDSDISFVGTTNTGTFSNNLSYTAGAGDLAGFHLVGNPYSHNITLMNTTLLDDGGDPYETQLGGCYILTNTNSWGVSLGTSSPIKPTQGFLIQITTDDVKKIQFSETPRAARSRSNGDNIEFIVSNSEYKDNTFALFDNVMGLNKIEHRNTEVPMIYIPQSGTNYAIAPMSDDTKMFSLNFKAATMGQYTLSMKAAGEYNYIHIIDRLTGEDIDMLLEGKYSFIGSPRDNESRFLVKLGYVPGSTNNNNEIFAYQSGSDIVVTGSGELQIFDVTGRSVMTTTINGVETIQVPTTGMYIFRLVGSEVKTQKIVVE